jgi:PKD repeat protein
VATANGCSDTITRQVVVNPRPFVDFTTQNNCQNNAVLFEPAASMNTNAIGSWSWAFGDGVTTTQQSPTHSYATAGTYNVTLTVVDTSGCTNTITKPVIIIPEPNVNFTNSQPACKQSSVLFNDLSNARWIYCALGLGIW